MCRTCAITHNTVIFESSMRQCQRRQKGKDTLIFMYTHNCSSQPVQPRTLERGGSKVSLKRKKKKQRKCFFLVAGTSHYDAQRKCARDVASKKGRRINHFARVLSMHAKRGRLHVRHVEPPEAVYVILSFPRGQAWGRESATVWSGRWFITTLHLQACSSMSWISSA